MLKVLHVITWLNRGGIETWLLSMLRTVPRASYEMDFFCKGSHAGDLAPEAHRLGARVFHSTLTLTHHPFMRDLKAALVEGRYQIVHNHLEAYSGLPVWIARRVQIPVISSFHNDRFEAQTWTRLPVLRQLRKIYARLSVSYALRASDHITGCSYGVLKSLFGGRNDTRSSVLYYGIEQPVAVPLGGKAELLRSLGWPPQSRLISHVGGFRGQKNHRGLVDIFARVYASVPSARLVLIGDGPMKKEIEALVHSRGLSESVRFLGVRDDVPKLLSVSDVFAFPSLHEGFGIAALEANAAGIPVVGTRIEGLKEAVAEGRSALLHDATDSAGMAASMIQLLNDPEKARSLGGEGRRRYESDFTLEASARRLMQLYQRCLEMRGDLKRARSSLPSEGS